MYICIYTTTGASYPPPSHGGGEGGGRGGGWEHGTRDHIYIYISYIFIYVICIYMLIVLFVYIMYMCIHLSRFSASKHMVEPMLCKPGVNRQDFVDISL